MRKQNVILVLLLTASLIQAQTNTLDGFLKSNWGSSKAEVKVNNEVKGYNYYEGEGVDENLLVATGANFAGESNCLIFWKFTSDKLFEGTVIVTPELDAKAMEHYKDIRTKITRKYGTGNTYESYDYPYEQGDGYWETAFRVGKGSLSTYWSFEDNNTISMSLDEDLTIKIKYQSTILVQEAIEKQEAANNDDL